MSRLTERKKDRYGNEYIATCGGAYFEEESVYKAFEKLAHYEDLEEQGRLIELDDSLPAKDELDRCTRRNCNKCDKYRRELSELKGRQQHYVKILPKYFTDVKNGIKTFEIRFNDRGYKVGDILYLEEFFDGKYTGRAIVKEICYMIDSPEYCKEGFVVLGLKDGGRLIETHQAAVILAEAFRYEHPCSFNGNDEWFSEICDLGDLCPDGKMSAIACWEQYIKVKLAKLKGEMK